MEENPKQEAFPYLGHFGSQSLSCNIDRELAGIRLSPGELSLLLYYALSPHSYNCMPYSGFFCIANQPEEHWTEQKNSRPRSGKAHRNLPTPDVIVRLLPQHLNLGKLGSAASHGGIVIMRIL